MSSLDKPSSVEATGGGSDETTTCTHDPRISRIRWSNGTFLRSLHKEHEGDAYLVRRSDGSFRVCKFPWNGKNRGNSQAEYRAERRALQVSRRASAPYSLPLFSHVNSSIYNRGATLRIRAQLIVRNFSRSITSRCFQASPPRRLAFVQSKKSLESAEHNSQLEVKQCQLMQCDPSRSKP
jgi:hypothetical protein